MNKQDRQGVRTASDLERKYQFGKRFSEIMGMADDAQKSVAEIESSLIDKINEQYSSFTRTTEEIQMEVGKVSETADTLCESVSNLSIRSDEIAASVATVTETTDTLKEEMSSLKISNDSITTEVSRVTTIVEDLENQVQGIDGTYFYIRYSQHSDGHDMTIAPTDDSIYMGTCSTYKDTAPTDYKEYTWSRIRGRDGEDGQDGAPGVSSYFHVKYSDDGETFTANNGEDIGAYIGTLVDTNVADSTVFGDYTWKKIEGEQGLQGPEGKIGDSCYFHVMFSANADGSGMTEEPDENTKYMGTCSSSSATAPTNKGDYVWTQCKGDRGERGDRGEQGEQGVPGTSQYFHVKYSDDGKTFTGNNGEILGDWMGTCITDSKPDPVDFSSYTWKKIKGEQGLQGPEGQVGDSCYFFVKFSPNVSGDPMTEEPDENTKYMGTCSTSSNKAPSYPAAYNWTQCRGNDGEQGVPGEKGDDGRTSFLHIKYSDDGSTFSGNMLSGDASKWVSGLHSRSATATYETPPYSGNADFISWVGVIPVTPGQEFYFLASTKVTLYPFFYNDLGFYSSYQSVWCSEPIPIATVTIPEGAYYLRFSLATNECSNFEEYQNAFVSGTLKPHLWKHDVMLGEALGAYIGTLVDFEEADSTNFDDYTWKKFTTDVDEELDNIRTTIIDQRTNILEECDRIVMSAVKDTVTKEGLNEYKETLKSEFVTTESGLLGRVEAAEKSIKETNGKLEEELKKISKYFSFTIDGLEIGATYLEDGEEKKSPNKVVIDNDDITIYVGEKEVVTFKADGTGVVPDFKATRSADILGLRFTQDSTHINCDYIGEVI